MCAQRKAGRRPFPWFLAVHHQSLVSRSPLPCKKRSAWGGGWIIIIMLGSLKVFQSLGNLTALLMTSICSQCFSGAVILTALLPALLPSLWMRLDKQLQNSPLRSSVWLCLMVATQRVVVVTSVRACSLLSFSRHMPHTQLLLAMGRDPFNAMLFLYWWRI